MNRSAAFVVVGGNTRALEWESELDVEVTLDEEMEVDSAGG